MKRTLTVAAIVFLTVVQAGTAATAPTVSTSAASSVTSAAATLNGFVNPNGTSTNWYFEYGTSTSYGTKTTAQSAGSGTTAAAVSAPVVGLQGNRTYHFRLVATSDGGSSQGADQTFSTGNAPAATTNSASSIGSTTARLNGSVNPNGQSTTWYFDYGTSTAYGAKTTVRNAGSGTHTTNVAESISGLTAGTTYHFRLVATSGAGTGLPATTRPSRRTGRPPFRPQARRTSRRPRPR